MGLCNSSLNDDDIKRELNNSIKFVPNIRKALVVKVYDGDTITIVTKLKLFGPKYKFSVRLKGIDAPEMKTKDIEEKKVAIKSRDWLSERILGRKIILKNVSYEKYGRLLADIYYDGKISLNQRLVDNRLAVKYDGGTKQKINWKKYSY
jgi:micrococcal nuclease